MLSVMSNGDDNFIAGNKRPEDWYAMRERLRKNEADAWREAFSDYFEARLTLRYLRPIKVLQDNGTLEGEGFSIVTIQCSLIEFLESTAQGTNYRYLRLSEALQAHEYAKSQDIFVDFLQNREPFSATFDGTSAQDFYVGVRCGLLHEARTKNGWRIWAEGPSGTIADVPNRIVYRNNFQEALLEYIKAYGKRLERDQDLQQGFIRKFDHLCV
jgi:hypothetical protein